MAAFEEEKEETLFKPITLSLMEVESTCTNKIQTQKRRRNNNKIKTFETQPVIVGSRDPQYLPTFPM